jgi:DNA polymerase-1
LSREGTEADDLIASYARAAAAEGAEVVVATNDKDILQLASDRIRIYSTNKGEAGEAGFALLGVDEVRGKWGVEPAQIADVLALTGDASDNIPGVAGVGPKTAVALIREHGSIDRLLSDLSVIANEKLRLKIEAARRQIMENREMVRLDDDLELDRPWRDLTVEPRYPELIAALRACEFRGLVAEVEREADLAARRSQGDLFGFTG